MVALVAVFALSLFVYSEHKIAENALKSTGHRLYELLLPAFDQDFPKTAFNFTEQIAIVVAEISFGRAMIARSLARPAL